MLICQWWPEIVPWHGMNMSKQGKGGGKDSISALPKVLCVLLWLSVTGCFVGPLTLPLCVQLCRVARRPVECRTVLLLSLMACGLGRWSRPNEYQEDAAATRGLKQCALESGALLCLSKVRMAEFIYAQHLSTINQLAVWTNEKDSADTEELSEKINLHNNNFSSRCLAWRDADGPLSGENIASVPL